MSKISSVYVYIIIYIWKLRIQQLKENKINFTVYVFYQDEGYKNRNMGNMEEEN